MEIIQDWLNNNSQLITTYALNILIALVILYFGRKVGKYATNLFVSMLEKRSVDKAVGSFLSSIVYSLIMVAVLLMALGQLGVETTSFIAILGAAGLAIGLALKDSLSNFASGVIIILFRPFKAGDYIEAAGVAGSVKKIEIFSTTVNTPDNKVIIIPNASITGSSIVNYSREEKRRIDLVIGVSYDSDIKLAKQVLTDVVNADERVLKDPAPNVAVLELADSSVNFVVRPWVNTGDYWPTRFSLMENIKLELDKAGVGIPFPQMDVHLHKQDN
ncbi:mechanosensitive ion channel [Paraneptunicella aestuarii]|uniref:mechanosensitive ion channel family protein n=1 Tax=Paraneptunicella aestuarii TaxID=2831148 RepID=UPI001E406A8D|nr:mechanosensitive ion channel domain-containing protein [Paraneptunicella aestuarii]UAA39285.1 mechanosensitive ion channel [Paraneptunicella aestuarii]